MAISFRSEHIVTKGQRLFEERNRMVINGILGSGIDEELGKSKCR